MSKSLFAVILGGLALTVGAGSAKAAVTIYDDFPGNSLNASLWTNVAGTVTVSGSNAIVGDPNAWSSMYSTQSVGDASVLQSYFFKIGNYSNNGGYQYFGLRDPNNGHYANLRVPGSNQVVLDITGTDEPGQFTGVAGDLVELRRTATNWQVYVNGSNTPVLQSSGTGSIGAGDDARIFLAQSPGSTASYDYVAIGAVPEPAGLALLGLTALPMMCRRRR